MPDIIKTLQNNSRLVDIWGETQLADGRTLSETLTLWGIPFWDVFVVDLARIYMTAVQSDCSIKSKIKNILMPYLIRAKYSLRDYLLYRHSTRGCFSWPKGKTILCLDFTEYMSKDVVQPIVTKLTESPNVNVVSLSDMSRHNMNSFSCHNGLYQTVSEHCNKQVCMQAYKLKQELLETVRELIASSDLMNIIRDDDLQMWGQYKNVFNSLFRTYLPLFIVQAIVAKHILEDHCPAQVISPDVADPRTRVYTLLCRQMGIPCLDVQFGLAGADSIEWRFCSADKVAVWGESSKDAMLEHGVPDEKIIITGSPRHDCLVNVPNARVKEMQAKLGVPNGSAMILLASAYQLHVYDEYSNPELLVSMKRSIFEAADKTEGISLIVKPHPAEDVSETKALAGNKKNIIFVSQKLEIRELTSICDAFISFGSTATTDALISGKLVICPVFPGWIWSNLYKDSGATLVPSSATEIFENFQLIANGDYVDVREKFETARQKFLSHWVFRADGRATERITELAFQMAGIGKHE